MSKTYYPVISRFYDRKRKVYVDPPAHYEPPSPEERDRLIRARCLRDAPVSQEEARAAAKRREPKPAEPQTGKVEDGGDEPKETGKKKGKKGKGE